MSRSGHVLTLLAICSCSGTSSRQHVSFAKLTFDMPAAWSDHKSGQRGVSTAVWTPDENADDKESLTVVRTDLAPALAHSGSPAVDNALLASESGLAGARASKASPILTKNGLAGVRVDVDFVPRTTRQSYHRVHVVLVDRAKASLIHCPARQFRERLTTT